MQYMLLITGAPDAQADWSDDERQADMKRWFTYTEDLQAAGVYVDGNALHGPETAKTVRNRDGETLTTDGPFAETKEVVAGYYIVDVDDEATALHWAARCPGADYGAMEVRPVLDLTGMA